MKYKIEDLLEKVIDNRGKTPPISGKGHLLLEINCLTGDNKFPNYNVVQKIVSKDTYNSWFRSGHPQKGDILIPTVGTLDAIAFLDRNDCCIAQNIIAFRADEKKCDGNFLYYLLKSPVVRKRLLNLNIGGVQPSIKVPHLKQLEVDVPDLETQKKIVRILSAFDNKIELNNKIRINLENQASVIFKKWFIDLEPFKTVNFKTTELGVIPNDWTVEPLGELFEFRRGVALTKNDVSIIQNNDHPFVVYGAGRDIFGYSKEYTLDIPSVLIAAIGAGAGTISRSYETKYSVTSNAFYVLPKNKIDYPYEVFALQNYNFKDRCSGSAQPMLSYSAFATDKHIFPSKDARQKFYDVCEPMLEKINKLMEQNNILNNIRDTLLPKLMNGTISSGGA